MIFLLSVLESARAQDFFGTQSNYLVRSPDEYQIGSPVGCSASIDMVPEGANVTIYENQLGSDDGIGSESSPSYYNQPINRTVVATMTGITGGKLEVPTFQYSEHVPNISSDVMYYMQPIKADIYNQSLTYTNFTIEYTGYLSVPNSELYTIMLMETAGLSLQIGAGKSCCGDSFKDILTSDRLLINTTSWYNPQYATIDIDLLSYKFYPFRMVFANSALHLPRLVASITNSGGDFKENLLDRIYQVDIYNAPDDADSNLDTINEYCTTFRSENSYPFFSSPISRGNNGFTINVEAKKLEKPAEPMQSTASENITNVYPLCSNSNTTFSEGLIALLWFYPSTVPIETYFTGEEFFKGGYQKLGGRFDTLLNPVEGPYLNYPYNKQSDPLGIAYGSFPGGQTVTTTNFTVEYILYFKPDQSGVHNFNFSVDGAVSLQLGLGDTRHGDFDQIVSNKTYFASNNLLVDANLTSGEFYPMKIVYNNNNGSAVLSMTMTEPDGTKHYTLDSFAFAPVKDMPQVIIPSIATSVTTAWNGSYTTDSTTVGPFATEDGVTGYETTVFYLTPTTPATATSVTTSWTGNSTMDSTTTGPYTLPDGQIGITPTLSSTSNSESAVTTTIYTLAPFPHSQETAQLNNTTSNSVTKTATWTPTPLNSTQYSTPFISTPQAVSNVSNIQPLSTRSRSINGPFINSTLTTSTSDQSGEGATSIETSVATVEISNCPKCSSSRASESNTTTSNDSTTQKKDKFSISATLSSNYLPNYTGSYSAPSPSNGAFESAGLRSTPVNKASQKILRSMPWLLNLLLLI